MDKNNTIGLLLISVILIGYFFYQGQQQIKDHPNQVETTDSTGTAPGFIQENDEQPVLSSGDETNPNETDQGLTTDTSQKVIDSLRQALQGQNFGVFAAASEGTEQNYTMENSDLSISFTNKGGDMVRAQLLNYVTFDSLPLILFDGKDQHKTFDIPISGKILKSNQLYFSTDGVQKTDSSQFIKFRVTASNGGYIEQTYTLPNKGFVVDYDLDLDNMNKVVPKTYSSIEFNWYKRMNKFEKNKKFENRYTKLNYKENDGDVEKLNAAKDAEETPISSLNWISYKQQFFNATLIGTDGLLFKNAHLQSTVDNDDTIPELKTFVSNFELSYTREEHQVYAMQYYLGPNHYTTLKKMNIDLEEIIDLGTGIMSWVRVISKYLIIPVFNFLEKHIGSHYGIIILILTLMIKIILLPLSYKAYLSQAKMKVLKPELDELKAKFKDDQSKFAQEQMKLYNKAGVSPLGGCLPSILPFPVLIAMYYFFPSSIELRQEHFLWATDLSTYDSIANIPNIPFYGDHISLFTLLMSITSIGYALTNRQMTATQDGPMKYMPYFFPIMLLGIFNSFPAALTYYYLLQNVLSILQQFIFKTFLVDEDKLHKQIQANKKKPKKTGGFADRLQKSIQDAQRQAEQQKGKKKK